MKYKNVIPEVKSFNDKELWVEHFISTEGRDRGGDIMDADGMEMDGIPVVLWQHGQDPVKGYEPIAKPLEFRIGKNKKGDNGIIAKTQFPNDDEGIRLYNRVKGGFLPNWSIGYDGNGDPLDGGGMHYKKWKLFEYSNVAIPMNADATGLSDTPSMKELCYKIMVVKSDTDNETATPTEGEAQAEAQAAVEPENQKEDFSILDKLKNPSDELRALLEDNGLEIKKIIQLELPELPDVKSLAEEAKTDITWSSMITIIDYFLNTLKKVNGKKRSVKQLCNDLVDSIYPYALAFSESYSASAEQGMELKEYNLNKNSDSPDSGDPAPQSTDCQNNNNQEQQAKRKLTVSSFYQRPLKVNVSEINKQITDVVNENNKELMKQFKKMLGKVTE